MPYQDLAVGGTSGATPSNYTIVQPANLSFGGVAETPITTTNLSYGDASGTGFSSYDTSANLFTNLFSSFTGGGSGSSSTGSVGGGATVTPTVNTAAIDGATGFISNLQQQLGGILGSIGSTGDGPTMGPTQVAYQPAQDKGLDLPVILAILAVGGVIYYATKG